MAGPETPDASTRRSRHSFHVTYEPEQIPELAKEIMDGTIAEVHMSLFTYWICEKPEHYVEAKKHIRELGVDQAYPICRIENDYIRKLVEDTYHLRPRYEYEDSHTGEECDCLPESPSEEKARPHRRASPPFLTRSLSKLSSVSALLRTKSDARVHRASPVMDPKIQNILRARQASLPLRPRSPWPARSEPLTTRGVKEQVASSTGSASRSTLSSKREYPPDTPDRPAPLNIRSRGPNSAPAESILRSFSTPVRVQTTPPFACSGSIFPDSTAQGSHNVSAREAHPIPSVHGHADERVGTSDASNEVSGRYNSSNDTLHRDGFNERRPHYELEPHELAESESNSPMGQSAFPSSEFGAPAELDTGSVFEERGVEITGVNKDAFGDNSQYVPGTDDEPSVDSSSFDMSKSQPQPGYKLTSPRSRPLNFTLNPTSTPAQRRPVAQARRAARPPNFGIKSVFHRPLPLRSYESEAFLFPTARAQGDLSHSRATSLTTSPSRGRRPLDIGGLNEFSRRVGPSNLRIRNSSSNNVGTFTGASSKHDSIASVDLSQFPDVPSSTTAAGTESPRNLHKVVTEAYMKQSLERTRARGAQLPIVELNSLSSFEAAWRNVNEQLLIAIYGRVDVMLTSADITFVDRIAKELRDGVGQITGYEWVGALFQHH